MNWPQPTSTLFPYTTLFRSSVRSKVISMSTSGGCPRAIAAAVRYFRRSEEHTSELQSQFHLVCRLLLEKKKKSNGHLSPDTHTSNMTIPTSSRIRLS